ncbi:hypothetical protein [Mycolicibacterium obuense]|uniref:Uncharacterized protein n=1 Tax=Mycolicibacterium obuense TaxID=1807 RepID=A0A0M2JS72_9MYCO|nr:hypothetical protein [Mycolicibacterium obuense]KKE99407.1 hypothetical protein WN67_24165 [Mycolicibacterium obuense]
MTVDDNENPDGHELDDDDAAQRPQSTGQEAHLSHDFIEDEEADPADIVAATDPKHEQKFRWWALGVIAGLCIFFALATLLVGTLTTKEAAAQIASDMAKTAIPTLLTLLGTAVAWAFKSEKD